MSEMKVLFHVNETEAWTKSLGNITNFLKDQPQGKVEVVANGPSVTAFTGSCQANGGGGCGCSLQKGDLLEQMGRLSNEGVVFAACRNSLKIYDIDEKTLPSFVKVVPAGITEIAAKQSEGYAYIKP
ncbi:DsrE family protein [Desulfofalx alkaliphila]|uniref:DsrE family protein n=1 Tax=Desulfofalx alkaliphila TaxID=105483 RepID=UPI0004E17015|nr:DsrE family protein [Desulfofalx alkaliphila]